MPRSKKPAVRKHAKVFTEPSLTKQEFKDECNINNIMDKFQRTGQVDHYAAYAPHYGEISQGTLADAMEVVCSAEDMFNDLPSSIRKRFRNEPGEFLAWIEDPANREEMRKAGLSKGRSTDNEPSVVSRRISDLPPEQHSSEST